MKKLLFLVLLMVVYLQVNAQSWAPAGAKWTYGMAEPFGPKIYFHNWIVTGDTVINGKTSTIIRIEGQDRPQHMKFITYEDNNVVYWYNRDTFTVLYDFNKNKGESWTIWNDTCGMLVTVDSTGTEVINGKSLKTLYITSSHSDFRGKTIQYIGNLMNPIPVFLRGCGRSWADTDYITGLRCYQDTLIGFYTTGAAPSCEFVGLEEKQKKTSLKLFPNPAQDKIFFHTNSTKISQYNIYNAVGQLVMEGKTDPAFSAIEVNTLQNGFYIIEMISGKSIQKGSFIIRK